MKILAPIVLFVYNRLEHTKKVINALKSNDLAECSSIYIYSDGPKEDASKEDLLNIFLTRQYIHTVDGFKSVKIVEHKSNKGLDASEIDAITEIIYQYGRVIVIEDDVIPHPFFLQFMNDALDFYETNEKVFTIGSFSPKIPYLDKISDDVYASYRTESWGWGTWRDRWEKCNWKKEYIVNTKLIRKPTWLNVFSYNRGGDDMYDNLIEYVYSRTDAWDARWQYCMYENNGVCVRPTKSLSYNIGLDGTGVHCGNIDNLEESNLMPNLYSLEKYVFHLIDDIRVPLKLQYSMRKFYRYDKTSWYIKLKKMLKSKLKKIMSIEK